MFAHLHNANRSSLIKRIGMGTAFVVAFFVLLLAVIQPTRAAVRPQGNMPGENSTTGGSNMMGSGMMAPGMMASTAPLSTTMPMASEMDAMLGDMYAMMAAMPVSGTLTMGDMGHMMQMMAMMHQHMGAMHMMAGGMMGNGMMTGEMMPTMPCADSTTSNAPPIAPQKDADSANALPVEPAAEPQSADEIHPPLVANPVRQSAEAGAVTVEVMPLPPSDPLEVAFEVVMNTHSVELGFDLAARATLTLNDETYVATEWEPDVPSGHHISGILRFTIDETTHAAFADSGMVTLELANIDGETVTFVYTVSAE